MDGVFTQLGHAAGCIRVLPRRGGKGDRSWSMECSQTLRRCEEAGAAARAGVEQANPLEALQMARDAFRKATQAAAGAQRQAQANRWVDAMLSGPTAAAQTKERQRRRNDRAKARVANHRRKAGAAKKQSRSMGNNG